MLPYAIKWPCMGCEKILVAVMLDHCKGSQVASVWIPLLVTECFNCTSNRWPLHSEWIHFVRCSSHVFINFSTFYCVKKLTDMYIVCWVCNSSDTFLLQYICVLLFFNVCVCFMNVYKLFYASHKLTPLFKYGYKRSYHVIEHLFIFISTQISLPSWTFTFSMW